ncbi:hypothetical protein BKM31_19040 [[Actinomadura] parvosata subsp. kistnae]|uniref:Uncharacterized protein n=1 Tax=[Actinomadura] parvosata subsp. kistnae TaxID=1909395 RepID=A0A1U9ZZ99_9ACTN|nr:hypothetical protein BKM31_19040 [Nonomuraea sp. ATCC 55076]
MAQAQRAAAQAERAAEAGRLAGAFMQILELHRAEFPLAQAPVAAPVPAPELSAFLAPRQQQALAGIGVFQRKARAAAKQRARQAAEADMQQWWTRANAERERYQWELTRQWQRLCGNDPEVVLPVLAEAFEDNEAPAVPVALNGAEVSLVVLAPGPDFVPERFPSRTAAGNISLKKLTKTERASYYTLTLCGYLLVTLREAFAVAPGLSAARAVVLRTDRVDAYGRVQVSCMLAGRFERRSFDGVRWDAVDAATVVNDTAGNLMINQKGAAKEPYPLDLRFEPELQALVNAVDITELTAR